MPDSRAEEPGNAKFELNLAATNSKKSVYYRQKIFFSEFSSPKLEVRVMHK